MLTDTLQAESQKLTDLKTRQGKISDAIATQQAGIAELTSTLPKAVQRTAEIDALRAKVALGEAGQGELDALLRATDKEASAVKKSAEGIHQAVAAHRATVKALEAENASVEVEVAMQVERLHQAAVQALRAEAEALAPGYLAACRTLRESFVRLRAISEALTGMGETCICFYSDQRYEESQIAAFEINVLVEAAEDSDGWLFQGHKSCEAVNEEVRALADVLDGLSIPHKIARW